ncbi:MAG: histone deacetylase, partial [Proteobacteria bacterium]|nr:histone deacetylase [Pseudomonadota bacterium]MBU4287155.1 histone deacetylase [Pseudomonadota bacterium]MCG2757136.1 histone deacetylase [Desulfobacteraceae bacterium]
MNKTGFLYDERYLLHDTGPYHPEVPARLKVIYNGIKDANLLPMLTLINASLADLKWIEAVHERNYINRFKEACLAGKKI